MQPPSVLEAEARTLSYIRGADLPLIEKTISEVLADTARRFPDRDALVVCHQNERLSWAELDRQATRTARGLAGLGLRPGDRAGIWAANCLEWIMLQHGAARAGVVLVNVNPAYRSHELRYVLRKSHIRALFLREKDPRANYREILAESRNGDSLPLEHTIWLGDASWNEMLERGVDFPADAAAPGDVAKKDIGHKSGWGDMPPKEREEALQQMGRDFPPHYRDAIEEYFRKLAAEEGSDDDK